MRVCARRRTAPRITNRVLLGTSSSACGSAGATRPRPYRAHPRRSRGSAGRCRGNRTSSPAKPRRTGHRQQHYGCGKPDGCNPDRDQKMLMAIASRHAPLQKPCERPRSRVGNSSLDHTHVNTAGPSQLKKLKAKKPATSRSCYGHEERSTSFWDRCKVEQPAPTDPVDQSKPQQHTRQTCAPNEGTE
jgi:hypothetical protein